MERPIGIEPTPEPWQVHRGRRVNNLRGTFRSMQSLDRWLGPDSRKLWRLLCTAEGRTFRLIVRLTAVNLRRWGGRHGTYTTTSPTLPKRTPLASQSHS